MPTTNTIYPQDTASMTQSSYTITPVAILSGCYPDKFGVPRQPGLARHATARIRFVAPYDNADALRGLEDFSHIWLTFLFHHSPQTWRPLVRPPRLGGNAKVGVFASRATHRPNRIGLSLVELVDIITHPTIELVIKGHDLVDGTPIIDIKPYLPWADSVDTASAGFAPAPPTLYPVAFSSDADAFLAQQKEAEILRALIVDVIGQDPRPAYHSDTNHRRYGVRLRNLDIGFHVDESQSATGFMISDICPIDAE